MSYKTELEKKIEKEKSKIIELNSELDRIKSQLDRAEAFVLGLQEALRLIPKDSDLAKKPETVLRHGSDMAKVRDVLRQTGEPMYINDILVGIGKEINKGNRENIGGSLNNYSRREEIFTRTAPNTFGLMEFGELKSTETNSNGNGYHPQQAKLIDETPVDHYQEDSKPEEAQTEDEPPW